MDAKELEAVVTNAVQKALEQRQDDRLAYTLEEAAPLVGVSTKALHNAISRGELPAKKQARKWLIRKDALLRWVTPRV